MAVVNIHHNYGHVPPGAVSIMRGTLFGNPYIMGVHGDRAAVVALYRRHLWRRLKEEPAFAAHVKRLHGQDLACCCAPAACHGDVLEKAAAWLANGGNPRAPT